MTRLVALALAVSCAALPGRPASAEEKAGGVEVRVESRSFPVEAGRADKPHWSPGQADKLKGKSSYRSEVVILSNRFLTLEVVPELGGRLIRATYRPGGDAARAIPLFWEYDKLTNAVSWSMGGAKWSFPHWEHGRKFAETAGYVVTRGGDGSATVHMDMRFDEFLTPAETKRYGLATNLRLTMSVTLAPGSTAFTYAARIENPLPIRYGTKLWFLVRPNSTAGAHYIFPAADRRR